MEILRFGQSQAGHFSHHVFFQLSWDKYETLDREWTFLFLYLQEVQYPIYIDFNNH